MKPIITEGGIFTALADAVFFKERLTVLNQTVAWDVTGDLDETACIDIDPFTIYETAAIVDDPLADK